MVYNFHLWLNANSKCQETSCGFSKRSFLPGFGPPTSQIYLKS